MTNVLLLCAIVSNLVQLVLLIRLLRQRDRTDLSIHLTTLGNGIERVDRTVREEMSRNRDEATVAARQAREEQQTSLRSFTQVVTVQMSQIAEAQKGQLDTF